MTQGGAYPLLPTSAAPVTASDGHVWTERELLDRLRARHSQITGNQTLIATFGRCLMPSPLVPVQYRSPAHATNFQTALVGFDAPCPACSQTCPWTASASGSVPHCPCDTTGEAA